MKFSIYYASELLQKIHDSNNPFSYREIYCNDLECLSMVTERVNNSPRAGKKMKNFSCYKDEFVEVGFAPYQIVIDFEDREIIVLDVSEF